MPRYYKIAGITIRLNCDKDLFKGLLDRQFKTYSVSDVESSDLSIEVCCKKFIAIPKGRLLMDEEIKWIRKENGGYFTYSVNPQNEIFVAAESNDNWKNTKICLLLRHNTYFCKLAAAKHLYLILGTVFRNAIVEHDGLFIHASSIDYSNQGVLFSAPSGTGKSTHTSLWTQLYQNQTRIINDDSPIIRLIDGIPYLFGAPWCGSSYKGINDSVPLSAMVAIERGETNTIRKLESAEALRKLLPRVFIPYFDRNLAGMAISTFEKVLYKVPSYNLACTIHPEAVELVRACLNA